MKRVVYDKPEEVKAFFARQLGLKSTFPEASAIGLEQDGEIIASVVYDNYNKASICMHVAAVPGARWMTKEYLYAAFAYPFLQLKVEKIIGLVGSQNLVAQRFDEHLGFTVEAKVTNAHPEGDLLIYSMAKGDCRWLGKR